MDDKGFVYYILILGLIVVGAVGFIGYRIIGSKQPDTPADTAQISQTQRADDASSERATWMWDGTKWQVRGTAPNCPDPLLLTAPVDFNKVTGVLYPGQVRGGDFKAHGGFRFDNSDNNVEVKLALDSHLVGASNYIERGEVQYILDFQHPCGVNIHYDHILTLSDEIKKLVGNLPEPKENDSRGVPINGPEIKAGTVVATAIGFRNPRNVGIDFGVADLRAESSPNAGESNDSLARYGVCWLNYFNQEDSLKVKSIAVGGKEGKTSAYCSAI